MQDGRRKSAEFSPRRGLKHRLLLLFYHSDAIYHCMNPIKTSKFMSLILRHRPEAAGIDLDPAGWADVEALLAGMARNGHPISRADLATIVETNNKRRYAFSEDGSRIRAVQGHSRAVELDLPPTPPPPRLFHGTVERFLDSIREKGLIKGRRQHVHLSADRKTADAVGRRRGQPVILTVDSAAMASGDHRFYISENGVWLTDHVPPRFIAAWD